ncbi:MAG: hypothetical protein EAY75_06810 [Bacteroidetes bacterium]|nr:MAG: hypothetical protein EAY75_06810 [Bacteroidota bacterium]
MQTNLSINTNADALVEEKRRKTIQKVKELPANELQVIFQSLFKDEIIAGFDSLPKPRKKVTVKELNDYMTNKRKENGFYD